MERIYLLEDDDSIRKLVIYALSSQGYEAQGFDCPSDFWKAMEGPQPALVLLDIMLPEEDGLSILQKLRASAATKKLPVIMLTAKNTEYDRVVGLDRLKAVHLNNSMNDRGSHKDRHARIAEGKLSLDAICRIINHPALRDLPFILETPQEQDAGYAVEIAMLREMRED